MTSKDAFKAAKRELQITLKAYEEIINREARRQIYESDESTKSYMLREAEIENYDKQGRGIRLQFLGIRRNLLR